MIASLTRAKGVWSFLEVAKVLPQYYFNLILSAETDEICRFFGNDIPNNVKLYPTQSDIHPFLEKTDLILNLSIPFWGVETFGMTILEAMPYGIPAIAPNVGGPTELIENGYNGYCVDVTNVKEIVKAINNVLDAKNYDIMCSNTLRQFDKFA